LSSQTASATPDNLVTHDPIIITENAGFTIPDPVNGGGSGTENDPYIIENWAINASAAHGIYIANTTAYFVVRNCLVENGTSTCYGIYLYNVVNGRIENNTLMNNSRAIYIDLSDYNNLNNNIVKNGSYAIYLKSSCDYNNLTGNTCENNSYGIYVGYSDQANLTANTCSNS